MIITEAVNIDIQELTPNGLTIAEEMEILRRDQEDEVYGPFDNVKSLMKSLNKK